MKTLALVALALCAVTAHAHVVVRPAGSVTGKDQTYTMRVPNEKQSPTTSMVLKFPAELTVINVDDQPGWKLELSKDPAGKIVRATWTGSLAPKEVVEFTFTAHNPSKAISAEWQAIQTYQDGTKSEWTGPEGSKSPASHTKIVPATP